MMVILIPNEYKDRDAQCFLRVVDFLRAHGARVLVSSAYSALADRAGVSVTDNYAGANLIVVIGGDGSILHAAIPAAQFGIPLVGINLGKVGFMASVEPNEIEQLADVLAGNFTYEERFMLKVTAGGAVYYALNDAVVSGVNRAHVVDLLLECDGRQVSRYQADAMIFSTPTGSTAYSFSAGGPVIDSGMECICATPVCPHALFARPFIFSGGARLSVVHAAGQQLSLSIDGADYLSVAAGQSVTVERAEHKLRLIQGAGQNFFTVLKNKLQVK